MSKAPLPSNESDRLASLLELDLDYSNLEGEFKNIVTLVSRTTGMEMSVVNLIDTFTQWTIANHGISVDSMARDESVCQFTILEDDYLEINDLSLDENHRDKAYVKGDPRLRYYFGVPLKTDSGINIGSLCVLGREPNSLNPEHIEFLKIIAEEVVDKLRAFKTISELKKNLDDALKRQKEVAVDLHDSLAGIIGISDVLMDREIPLATEDAEGFISLINERSNSMVALASGLITDSVNEVDLSGMCLAQLRDKLEVLYQPLARARKQELEISINDLNNHIYFSRSKLFSALNYPISGALYLSHLGARVSIDLDLEVSVDKYMLRASVKSNSSSLNDSSQLCPPDHFQTTCNLIVENDKWHCEVDLPVQVI
ncbi:MAG: GAF domain-containing protein [Daejeonella sp.]|uniref:GAF domain-containing protein n=1 Tax=Daejeonella sp. TaxID=2805397 RepID=UPI003C71E7AE